MTEDRFRKSFLVLLVVAISLAFLAMLQSFLMTVLVAAIFSGLAYPLYQRLERAFGGNRPLASAATMLLTLVLVIAPILALLGVVVNQAIGLADGIRPVVERLINNPNYLDQQLRRIPGIERIEPYRGAILTRAGDVVNSLGSFVVGSLSSTTRGTVAFVFDFFMVLYTMFFFLMDGPAMLRGILNHLPLRDDDKVQMTERFMSVTRATVKGTIIIGIAQGALAGVAFHLVGIPAAIFWGVVMVVLSIVPVVGSALVWVPACFILLASGAVWKATFLAAFCAFVVGSVDNILRPRLVGRDTKMHDLVILFSTLGGIVAFGPLGFIIGPVIAGLFVTSWEIFAVAYRDVLTDAAPRIVSADQAAPSDPGHPDVQIVP